MYIMYTSMATRVAFTAFRNNLASYLEKITNGEEIEVYDARRARTIVRLREEKKK